MSKEHVELSPYKRMAEENRVLEVRVGSHLFGTDNEDSDLDLMGVYMPGDMVLFGSRSYPEEADLSVQVKDDTGRNLPESVDRKLHDYRKFIRLLLQNNPNILHIVMTDEKNTVFTDEHGFGRRLLEMAPKFPHKGAYHRFVQYARKQQHKMLIKPQNYADLENGLGFLELMDDNRVLADVLNEQNKLTGEKGPFKDHGTGKHVKCGDLSFERGVFVKKAKKMIRRRLENATSRHVLFTRFGYDTKFASNLIQLLMEGIELVKTGWVQMPLAYAPEILEIKSGAHSAEHIAEWAESLEAEALCAFEETVLPDEPPFEEIEKFLVGEMRKWVDLTGSYSLRSLRETR